MDPEVLGVPEISELSAASVPNTTERASSVIERLRIRVGKLAVIGVLASAAMGTFSSAEAVEAPAAIAAAVSYGNLGYPWATAPCEFGAAGGASCANPNNNGDLYDWGEYGGSNFRPYRNGYEYRNCTDYVQWKESTVGVSVPGNWGNAAQWYSHAPPSEQAGVPKPWDVAVETETGGFGHVAFVESVNSDGTITVLEYNYDGRGDGDTRTGSPAALGFSKFINFGVHPGQDGSRQVEVDDGVVAAAAHSSGEQDVFWKGTDGNLWEAWYAGGRWNGPADLGMGELGSPPAAVVNPRTGRENVFWKGQDGNLWEAYYDRVWHGPIYLGMGELGSRPTAAEWGDQIDVFWKGMDGNLWEAVQNGDGSWAGPIGIGMGRLGSAPTAVAHQSGEQDVFWKGQDGNLWEAWYAGGRWNGPASLGMGPLGSAPTAAVQPVNNEEAVFWKGTDGNIWQARYDGSWHGPSYVGMGALGSAPSATAWGNEVDIFWRGLTSNLFEAWDGSGQWNGPASLGMGPIPEA